MHIIAFFSQCSSTVLHTVDSVELCTHTYQFIAIHHTCISILNLPLLNQTTYNMTSIKTFPVELLQLTASFLPLEGVLSFASANRKFYNAIHDGQFVFRSLFYQIYEPPRPQARKDIRGTYDFKAVYKQRHKALYHTLGLLPRTNASHSITLPVWTELLDVLVDIVKDARPKRETPLSQSTSLNISCLHKFLASSPLLAADVVLFRLPNINPNLVFLRLVLCPLRPHPPPYEDYSRVLSKMRSVVYDPSLWAGFLNDTLNDPDFYFLALDGIASLMRHHVDPSWHGTTFSQKALLDEHELPSFWDGGCRLEDLEGIDSEIPKRWFGAYTYCLDTSALQNPDLIEESGDDALAELVLNFDDMTENRSQRTFTGTGSDIMGFGITSGVLSPYQLQLQPNIGWKQLSFIKNYFSHQWSYFGVMLPGNNLIFGFWKDPTDAPGFGAFMYWAVPDNVPSLAGRVD